jgi:hypothetical protein
MGIEKTSGNVRISGTLILLRRIVSSFVLIYLVLIGSPIRYGVTCPGLDGSWHYALNDFFHRGIIFGRDVVWTYGPFGFINRPQNIGSNLVIAFAVQILLWVTFSAILIWIVTKTGTRCLNIVLFAILFTGGQCVFNFAFFGIDYYISLIVLLLLSISMISTEWKWSFSLAGIFCVLLFFVKFSTACLSYSALVASGLIQGWHDPKRNRGSMMISLGFVPCLTVATYFAYNPSITDLWFYLFGMVELSSGYSVAMSLPWDGSNIIYSLGIFTLYVWLMSLLYRRRQHTFRISLVMLVPLFFSFKHGMVREDRHVFFFFSYFLLILGIIVLFTNFTRKYRQYFVIIGAALLLWGMVFKTHYPGFRMGPYLLDKVVVTQIRSVFGWESFKGLIDWKSGELLARDRLPNDLLSNIGDHTVGIFPNELAYAAANDIRFVPFPVCQSYSAYTSYLDRVNAAFISDETRAPDMILLHWNVLDNRQPYMDVPATWSAMYSWYDECVKYEGWVLLSRRIRPRLTTWTMLNRSMIMNTDEIPICDTQDLIALKVDLNLSLRGRIQKFLYKVLPTYITLSSKNGREFTHRVVPATLQNGLIINFLPRNQTDVSSFFRTGRFKTRIIAVRFHGAGLRCYSPKMQVETYIVGGDDFNKIDFCVDREGNHP